MFSCYKLKNSFFLFATLLMSTHLYAAQPSNDYLPLTSDVFGKELTGEETLPRNFRHAGMQIDDDIRSEGLKELPIAGTAQFTGEQLKEIANQLQKKLLVVDLREETHLILEQPDGTQLPITAYASLNTGNVGKSKDEIFAENEKYKRYVLEQGSVTLYQTENSEVILDDEELQYHADVSNIYTEKEIVEKISRLEGVDINYEMIPMTDHQCPKPEIVDDFLNLYNQSKNDSDLLLVFHCQAGRGRTGLAMVMSDILDNAVKHDLTLEEILKRQEALGSPDFSKVKSGRQEQSLERFKFIKHFYSYVTAVDGYHSGVSYSFYSSVYPVF